MVCFVIIIIVLNLCFQIQSSESESSESSRDYDNQIQSILELVAELQNKVNQLENEMYNLSLITSKKKQNIYYKNITQKLETGSRYCVDYAHLTNHNSPYLVDIYISMEGAPIDITVMGYVKTFEVERIFELNSKGKYLAFYRDTFIFDTVLDHNIFTFCFKSTKTFSVELNIQVKLTEFGEIETNYEEFVDAYFFYQENTESYEGITVDRLKYLAITKGLLPIDETVVANLKEQVDNPRITDLTLCDLPFDACVIRSKDEYFVHYLHDFFEYKTVAPESVKYTPFTISFIDFLTYYNQARSERKFDLDFIFHKTQTKPVNRRNSRRSTAVTSSMLAAQLK